MGFRFRRSIKICPGIRLNFNKKSVGVSMGTTGARYTINSDGRKTVSAGIPGTGLYWTETKKSNNSLNYKNNSSSTSNNINCLIWFIFWPFLIVYYYFKFLIKLILKGYEILKGDDEKKKKMVYAIIIILVVLTIISLIGSWTTENKKDLILDDNVIEKNNNIKEDVSKENKIKEYNISSDEYFLLINDIFIDTTKNNEYLYYAGYSRYYPYVQIAIKPKKQINKKDMDYQAEIIGRKVLTEFKKYKYKSGGFLSHDFEYINIYFYDYTSSGKLSRNGGPFMQFEIMNINKITYEDIIW